MSFASALRPPLSPPLVKPGAVVQRTSLAKVMASLFRNNEQGAWYDPSDFERYMSPKGPELVTNGTFAGVADGTDIVAVSSQWRAYGTPVAADIQGGRLRLVTDAASEGAALELPALEAGKTYEVTYTYSGDGIANLFTNGTLLVNTPGRFVYTQNTDAKRVYFRVNGNAAGTGYYDNISVRELPNISTASLFQDAAGTTPVTAMEQPVGLMLDKRLGAQPVALAVGAGNAVGGTFTNTALTESTASEQHGIAMMSIPISPDRTYTEFEIKAGARTWAWIYYGGYTSGSVWINLSNGTLGTVEAGVAATVTALTDGWYRVKFIRVNTQAGTGSLNIYGQTANGATAAFVGSGSAGFYLRNVTGAQIPGNHASQATTTARPLLSARKNLLTKTEQLDDGVWAKINGTTVTVGNQVNIAATASSRIEQSKNGSVGTTYTASAVLSGTGTVLLGLVDAGGAFPGTYSTPIVLTATPTRYAITRTQTDAASTGIYWRIQEALDQAATVFVSDAQLEIGSTATRYQRVNTATDYDWVGFPIYLKYDGVDDFLTFSLPTVLTSGTIAHAALTENTGTVYGANTVHVSNNLGFGLADATGNAAVQGVSGNGTGFQTPNAPGALVVAHVGLTSANGATVRSRYNLGASVSQASVTNFNGTAWRMGRTLNDGGIRKGNDYGTAVVGRILTASEEASLIRNLASKAGAVL